MHALTIILVLVGLAVSVNGVHLKVGRHYTSDQGQDSVLTINPPGNPNLGNVNWPGLTNNKAGNDMSRFQIDGPFTWAFYDNADYSGTPLWTYTGPTNWVRIDEDPDIDTAYNDKVSSIKIVAPSLYIGRHYTKEQGQDSVLTIDPPGNPNLGNVNWPGLTNNKAGNDMSRFKIDGPFTWAFYDNTDYSGTPLWTYTGPTADFVRIDEDPNIDTAHNDKVSSVKLVVGPTADCVKQDWDYLGEDITSIPNIADVDACVDECRKLANCVAITYDNRPGDASKFKNCWVKHKEFGGNVYYLKDVQSANLACAKPANCPAGEHEELNRCVACPANHFCPGGEGVAAAPCPAGSTSPAGQSKCTKQVEVQVECDQSGCKYGDCPV